MIKVETFVVGPLETNCYLVYSTDSKTGFLIDPGDFDKRVVDEIEKNGIRIKNIINTHGHSDHTAGNRKFGYPVLIHELDAAFLKNPVKNLSFFTGQIGLPSSASKLLKDNDNIKEGEIEFDVLHTPGHTPGGISLKMGNKVFTGDTLFQEGVGRTDLHDSSEKDLLDAIKNRLMVFDDKTEVLPGHGPASTIGHERKHNPFL